jgi:hypothetical protein
MYHTTGFSREEIIEIAEQIEGFAKAAGEPIPFPPSLGMFTCVCVTLTYLRRNRRQVELAEQYDTSQPTISRAISALTTWIDHAFRMFVPVAEELDADEQYIVDGTLAPCWSWADRPELYSGKHKTTGVNLQVVCDLAGNLRYVSDDLAGSRHDSKALDISGLLEGMEPSNWIGDKGYVGKGMITPIKKPSHRKLLAWEKEFNKAVNKIRWIIERAIANLKTWRILHIDYRRPYETFSSTVLAVLGLEFFRKCSE